MRFANWYLLLLIPPAMAVLFLKQNRDAVHFSNVNILKKSGMGKTFKHRIGDVITALAMVCFIIALARPQLPAEVSPVRGEGIDIVMVLDVSGSMASIDFEPNRLEVARATTSDFIDGRYDDRIGLVIFGGTAYTRMPLTLDHEVVQQSLAQVNTDSVSEEGTAIGMAVSVAVNRLKKSESDSKVMILVTDGDNNAGAINPETASRLAADLGIRIYTVGVGSDETIIPYTYFGRTQYQTYETGLNEALLTYIADTTGGQYFRAEDENSLASIFEEINGLERTEFERDAFRLYDEWAFGFIVAGLLLFLFGIFFKRYYYIQIP